MADIYEQIARVSAAIIKSTSPDEKARLNAELLTLSSRLPTRGRKAEFDTDEDGSPERSFEVRVKALYERPSRNDAERETAAMVDDCLVLATLLRKNPRDTKLWRDCEASNPAFRKAMDSSAGAGWIPTDISADLHAQVRLQTKVAALLRQITMPTPVYKLPVQGNPPTAYLGNENSGADDDLNGSLRVKASDLAIGGTATLTAKKVGVRVVPSVELTEDSIIPALPLIREESVRAMAEAVENAVVNGKKVGTLDSDVTTSDDVRHWFDGLRAVATGASQENGVAVVAPTTPGVLTIADIRRVRTKMGRYALNPSDCFWLTNSVGYNQMLSLTDGTGHPVVATIDKFGPNAATLVTGSLAALDGYGIILSQFVREDLNHAGLYDGVTTDASMILLVNRRAFCFGTYRTPTLKSQELISTDQIALCSIMRGDFQAFAPTKPACGFLYDIRSTT